MFVIIWQKFERVLVKKAQFEGKNQLPLFTPSHPLSPIITSNPQPIIPRFPRGKKNQNNNYYQPKNSKKYLIIRRDLKRDRTNLALLLSTFLTF